LQVIRWQTPWPLIQISGREWVIMRDHPSRPAAIVRYLDDKPDNRYRVVRWAPDPVDRRLFEYFSSLEMADMAVTFVGTEHRPAGAHDRAQPRVGQVRTLVLVAGTGRPGERLLAGMGAPGTDDAAERLTSRYDCSCSSTPAGRFEACAGDSR
jgi:hypothetical protein